PYIEWTRFAVVLPLLQIPPAQEIPDRYREELRVVDCGVAHPLSGRHVTHHEAGGVSVAVRGVTPPGQPYLLGDQLDVLGLTRQKQPAGSYLVFFGISLEDFRGV